MKAKTPGQQTATPRRRGWRIPAKMPRAGSPEYIRLREELGQPAAYRHMKDWPRRTPEEREKERREFKEPTADEITAFRLRHAIPKDWTVDKCACSWVVESPLWPQTHPTPESKFWHMARVYSRDQRFYDEFSLDLMELGGKKKA